MARKRTILIIFFAGIILLITGFGSSYFWLTRIYLPEQIDTNENSQKLNQWVAVDNFIPPADGKITAQQFSLFMQTNLSLSFLFRKLRRQFEEHSWRFAIDIIKMQPEWQANKYVALKKFNLSPREYDWIVEQVVAYWIYRWQESSIAKLKEYGWELKNISINPKKKPVNYELFLEYEEELDALSEIFWPNTDLQNQLTTDSTSR
jgi:hypothetical protein